MLKNAYLPAKIGADTTENERNFAKNWQVPYPPPQRGVLASPRITYGEREGSLRAGAAGRPGPQRRPAVGVREVRREPKLCKCWAPDGVFENLKNIANLSSARFAINFRR